MRIETETDLTTAATELGVSYVAARNWVITGKLRGERRYGRWVIDEDDLNRILVERKEPEE